VGRWWGWRDTLEGLIKKVPGKKKAIAENYRSITYDTAQTIFNLPLNL
jgi:hypothetical protein